MQCARDLCTGAVLYDVKNCSSVRKNAAGIAQILDEAGIDIVGGEVHAADFGGWCVDNTRANMAALSILAEERPAWVNTGCIAHGLALAMKDMCRVQRTSGRYSTTWGCEWLAQVNDSANTVANYINDAGNAKSILHDHQKSLWGGVRSIDVSVPTRFATNLFVMKAVARSKAALVLSASDARWEALDGKAQQVQFARSDLFLPSFQCVSLMFFIACGCNRVTMGWDAL
jgi:hypothetical protein